MPTRTTHRASSLDDTDPLALAIAPPPDETSEERAARLREEQHSKAISDSIDEELEIQRQEVKRGVKPIKILLLGQSESGKSTTLKNFQLLYEPKAFSKERAGWRGVIFLNICRSIHVILDAMTYHATHVPHLLPRARPELLKLKARLQPVVTIEELLIRRLTEDSGETEATQLDTIQRSRIVLKEVAVNASLQWKGAFARHKLELSDRDSFDSATAVDWEDPNDPGIVLNACSEDIKKLWRHPTIQEMLLKQNLRLEEMAGFFLDALDEVTSPRYMPSDEHILRARLKTLGVTEHRFKLNGGNGVGSDWRIFDVGGHRSLRSESPTPPRHDAAARNVATSVHERLTPPISAFDQVLTEAPKVNRLEDSVHLWTSIISNRLLQHTTIILFLNKIDLMQQKLASGHSFAGLRRVKKFAAIMREQSPLQRTFYCHLTNVTDMNATKFILGSIRESIMQIQLREAQLMM
ncbi:guanine nucleotide binding protein, alpha subunit [Schizophyllum amplum]|uniref:Guanine nucleotide binding protein, alpha subunit n=1 Tax=Schizophyllum amplum TaxID=97359 RepID=A0A550C667_9AGAR|nr:guanine nucleotide binding protein, alpha subunit [Auriculariopsis ampla]